MIVVLLNDTHNSWSGDSFYSEVDSWCRSTFNKSIDEFNPDGAIDPYTFRRVIRIRCHDEKEAMLFKMRWS